MMAGWLIGPRGEASGMNLDRSGMMRYIGAAFLLAEVVGIVAMAMMVARVPGM